MQKNRGVERFKKRSYDTIYDNDVVVLVISPHDISIIHKPI